VAKFQIPAAAARVLIAAAVFSSFLGIGALAAASHDSGQTQTLHVLDRAIHRLSLPASDYRAVLSDALDDLPADADRTAADTLRSFLDRAPQAGVDFQCSRDFIANRARNMLERLGDMLRNEYVARLEPVVCSTTPYALDLAHARSTGAWLDIYGYDFDLVNPEMVLVTKNGFRDVSTSLVRRSPTHLAFKLGEHLHWSADVVSLGLVWGHLIHHSIALAQPTSTLCPSRIETLSTRTISVSPHFSGNSSPRSPGSQVTADTALNYSSNKLEATVCTSVADPDDRSIALGGCSNEFLHTTDPDWIIEGILGDASPEVSSAVWQGTSLEIRLNEIRFLASADRACVSPMAYLEARRTGTIDAATRRSLDRQINTIPPAALTMRPRFVLIPDAK
jgi:hypothetical protein